MSAIASFHVIDRADIARLAGPDPAAGGDLRVGSAMSEVLATCGRRLDPDLYPYSGGCMLYLLEYLIDRGIPIMTSEHDDVVAALRHTTVVLLTPAHRVLLPLLDPAAFTQRELRESMSEVGDFEEVELAAMDGLNILRDGIAGLSDTEVFVLTIG